MHDNMPEPGAEPPSEAAHAGNSKGGDFLKGRKDRDFPRQRRVIISPPPRLVPFTLKLSAIFGNRMMIMAWLIPGFVFCGIAHELRKAGVSFEPGMPWWTAAVWPLAWLFFLGVIGYMTARLAQWIMSSDLRLLENGLLGQAVLRSKTEIDLPGDGGPLFRLRFDYEAGGRKFHAVLDTSFPDRLLDDAVEPILYDPQKPRKSILLDELPAHIELDGAGNIKHRYPFMGLVYLAIPAGTLAAMIYMAV